MTEDPNPTPIPGTPNFASGEACGEVTATLRDRIALWLRDNIDWGWHYPGPVGGWQLAVRLEDEIVDPELDRLRAEVDLIGRATAGELLPQPQPDLVEAVLRLYKQADALKAAGAVIERRTQQRDEARAERRALWVVAKQQARYLRSATTALEDTSLLRMAERDAETARGEVQSLRTDRDRCLDRVIALANQRDVARAEVARLSSGDTGWSDAMTAIDAWALWHADRAEQNGDESAHDAFASVTVVAQASLADPDRAKREIFAKSSGDIPTPEGEESR